MKYITRTVLICGLTAALPAASLFAQGNRKGNRDRTTDRAPNQRETERYGDRGQENPQQKKTNSARDRWGRVRVDPQGWVTIYTDYDNDGRIDGKETIFFVDFLRARGDSQMRHAADRNRRDQRRSPYPRQQQMAQVQGTIQDQAEFDLRGHDEAKFLIAKINTEDDKTARVVLGTKDDLKKLNLTKGNVVTVKGERHRINNKPVLFARTVSAQGRTVNVTPPKSQREQRVRGTIESLEKREFQRRDGEFVIGKVDLVNGRTRTVILGPSEKLQPLKLKAGDEIRLMARNGRFNNNPALVASEIHAKDRSVNIPYMKPNTKDRSNDSRKERTTLKPNTEDVEDAIDR